MAAHLPELDKVARVQKSPMKTLLGQAIFRNSGKNNVDISSCLPEFVPRYYRPSLLKLDPAKTAGSPLVLMSSSMSISRLYFATRSPRHGAPDLRWPARSPTVRSAMKSSVVSPDRCDTKTDHPRLYAFVALSKHASQRKAVLVISLPYEKGLPNLRCEGLCNGTNLIDLQQ